jgi:hypothetical protein
MKGLVSAYQILLKVSDFLEKNPEMSFMTKIDGLIVVAVLVGHDGENEYIHHLAESKDARRKDIGCLPVDACIQNVWRPVSANLIFSCLQKKRYRPVILEICRLIMSG